MRPLKPRLSQATAADPLQKRSYPSCKPGDTGSIPVRSTEKPAGNGGFSLDGRLLIVQDARLLETVLETRSPVGPRAFNAVFVRDLRDGAAIGRAYTLELVGELVRPESTHSVTSMSIRFPRCARFRVLGS
jgi:hypothetical protein